MAIKRDEQQVSIQPSGRMVREFRTDLPGPSGMVKAQELGAEVSRMASLFGEAEARETAKQTGASAVIPKDEQGNYQRPETPEGFGILARNVYNQVVTDRVAYSSAQDFEAFAQQVRANNPDDPARAASLLEASATARIEALDPQVRLRAEPLIRREVNQHMGSILMEDARRRRTLEIQEAENLVNRSATEAFDLFALNTPEGNTRGEEAVAFARRNAERLVAVGARPPSYLTDLDNSIAGLRASGTIMARVSERLMEGTLTIDQVDDLIRITRSPYTDGENVMGIRPEDIRENITDPRARDALAARLERMRTTLSRQVSTQQRDATTNAIIDNSNSGARGRPAGVSEAVFEDAMFTWARNNQVNVFAPDGSGLDSLFRQFGALPTNATRGLFANSNLMSPEQLDQRLGLFRHLNNMPISGGEEGTVIGGLSRNDFNFMYHYDAARRSGETSVNAAERARELLARGRAAPTSYDDLSSAVRNRIRENDGVNLTDAKLLEKVDNFFPETGVFSRANWQQSTFAQRRTILSNIYSLMATNDTLPVDDAIKQGVRQFMTQHRYDSELLSRNGGRVERGSIVSNSQAIPSIFDWTGSGGSQNRTTEYARLYVDGVLRADRELNASATALPDDQRFIPRQQSGFNLPDDLGSMRYGRDYGLSHTGRDTANPGFNILVRGQDDIWRTVRDYQGNEVVVNLGVPAQRQDEYARNISADRAAAREINRRAGETMPDVLEGPNPGRFGPINLRDAIIERPSVPTTGTPGVIPRNAPRPTPGGRRDQDAPILPERRRTSAVWPEPAEADRPVYDSLRGFAVPAIAPNVNGLNRNFASSMRDMLLDMPEDLRGQVRITSAARTRERQTELWNDAIAKYGSEAAASRWVARPGGTTHETGVAADLQASPAARRWMHSNASRFGLHFPLAHEPWHLEPISARRNGRVVSQADSEDWRG